MALQGSGYLVVSQGGVQLYTRAGDLTLDANGNLVAPSGGFIQGWQADAKGVITTTGATTNIQVPPGLKSAGGASLASYSIGANGIITGSFTDGTTQSIAQLAMAAVTNPIGLSNLGNNLYSVTSNSGQAVIGTPGAGGNGTLIGGSLESSNVDLSKQLTDLIVAQESYQANTKVISSTSQALNALIQNA